MSNIIWIVINMLWSYTVIKVKAAEVLRHDTWLNLCVVLLAKINISISVKTRYLWIPQSLSISPSHLRDRDQTSKCGNHTPAFYPVLCLVKATWHGYSLWHQHRLRQFVVGLPVRVCALCLLFIKIYSRCCCSYRKQMRDWNKMFCFVNSLSLCWKTCTRPEVLVQFFLQKYKWLTEQQDMIYYIIITSCFTTISQIKINLLIYFQVIKILSNIAEYQNIWPLLSLEF